MRQIFSSHKRIVFSTLLVVLALAIALISVITYSRQSAQAAGPSEAAFQQASQEFNIPEDLLKGVCQVESHMSTNKGQPLDGDTYGCGLVKQRPTTLNDTAKEYGGPIQKDIKKQANVSRISQKYTHSNTLDQAAQKLGVAPETLQTDLTVNVRGVAYILSDDAQKISANHQLPTKLEGWRPALEVFSNSSSRFAAHLYASQVYKQIKAGFETKTDKGDMVSVKSQNVSSDATTIASKDDPAPVASLPEGCTKDGNTEYPGAVNCILDPAKHDCDLVPGDTAPCSYFPFSHYSPTYRQGDGVITHVVVHDIEGSAASAISTFEQPDASDTSHYIVDKDGTVYQMLHERDVAFHAGNLWYNQHSIGIEHDGIDTGYAYYNSAEYQASAKLTAYLAKKYNIPVEHDHIVSHGTIPGPNLANTPNHVDPGPYWLWSAYLKLVQQELGKESYDTPAGNSHVIALRPESALRPAGPDGTETADGNFNFFYLYNGPDTKSGQIASMASPTDPAFDETNNVEPEMSYYYTEKVEDPSGTGNTLYKIWYGASDPNGQPLNFTHAKEAWLAVPANAVVAGGVQSVTLKSTDGNPVQISGTPKTNTATADYHVGDAPDGAVFASAYKVTEDGTTNVWYEINLNHT